MTLRLIVPYRSAGLGFAACIVLMGSGAAALAQEDKKTDDDKPADPDTGQSTIEETTLGVLPNPLTNRGVKFAATYIGETLGNASGGLKQGAIYEGRLNLAVDADLQKLLGMPQTTFHANVFQIHGSGLSRGNLQNFMTVSGIEALPSTRLYEIWLEKKWGHDQVSLKAGQLAADPEFFNTKYTDVFVNASMGWPAITSVNLPSGGPSPPLAALGARLAVNVSESLSVLGAAFNGDAAGPGIDDPQQRDRYGTNSGSMIPRSFSVSFNTPGTTTRAIHIWRVPSSLAAGGIPAVSPTNVFRRTVHPSSMRQVAGPRRRYPEPRPLGGR